MIVDAPLCWFLSAQCPSRVHPPAAFGSVCAIVADGTPVLFTASPLHAATLAERLLQKMHKRAAAERGRVAA
jgi:hypothetical protein